MIRRTLFWKSYPYILLIIIASLILTSWYASSEMRKMYIEQLTITLEERARLIDRQFRSSLTLGNYSFIDQECKKLGKLINTRITVIDTLGNVLGDSEKEPNLMENHGTRPEIISAFKKDFGVASRFSNTLQKNMLYVALAMKNNQRTVGLVRTSLPVSEIENSLSSFYTKVAVGGFVIIILAAIISSLLVRRITGPIRQLKEGAELFAKGDFQSRLQITGSEEIGALSYSMNKMAEQLDSRIQTIIKERNEREAILTSMSEGILALDDKERVVTLNRAVAQFLEINIADSVGKSIQEIVRLADLQDFIGVAIKSTETVETEISLPGSADRYFQIHGTALTDADNKRIGIVLVFNDISRLKKLENIRRDFVANVSHELKTPITAIIGSAETLLDNNPDKGADTYRFLEMIARQSDRLNILVDDLLTLARLEGDSESKGLAKTMTPLVNILESSIQSCHELSVAKEVKINLSCPPDLESEINKQQIEQALINLINNAIKNSEPKTSVEVKAAKEDSEIVLSVADQGCGIDKKHHSRLFERFYRVDKARSRDEGGTGLGLAIVKHIALSHNGRVSVESVVGQGSTFAIYLPV